MLPTRFLATVAAFLLLTALGSAAAIAETTTSLTVGVYDNKPTIFIDETGTPQGLFIDILEEIADREGWQLSYVDGTFADIYQLLETGRIDLLPALAFSREREAVIDFNNETVLANWAELYTPAGGKITSLLDLEGKIIGVKQGDIHFSAIKELVRNFNITCRFLEADEYTTVFEMLQAEFVQAGVVNRLYGHRNKDDFGVSETPVIFNPIEMRFGGAKGKRQEVLATIDSYLLRFTEDENSVYFKSINRWFVVDSKPAIPGWLLYLLAGIAVTTLFFFGSALLFRRQVKRRTAELTHTNARLEREVRVRIETEEQLRKLARIVETSSDAVALLDQDHRHILTNNSYLQEVAAPGQDPSGRKVGEVFGNDFFESELRDAAEKALAGSNASVHIGPWLDHATTSRWDVSFTPYYANDQDIVGYVMSLRNVSSQVELLNRLKNAQKMEAIGLLAGGVAHDLNNILSGLVSYPDMLLAGLSDKDPMSVPLQTIKKSGERAAAIVQDLLTLARRGIGSMKPLNLNLLIDDFLASPEYAEITSWATDFGVRTVLSEDLFNLNGCDTHLAKILLNLTANGAEAMPEGGVLSISTENIFLGTDHHGYELVPAGEYVRLTLSDTGIGMTPEELNRIFEPFYSRKEMGRSGTGLGMAIVWGAVKDHEGYIDIDSKPGAGTSFSIYFPATREALEEIAPESLDHLRGGGQSVLVVDDMEDQRLLAEKILTMLNYRVETAVSGEAAINRCRSQTFDLILLDMLMPGGIDGLETLEQLCSLHPGQKVVIASGFAEPESARKALTLGAGAYINKPYTITALARAIHREFHRDSP